MHEASIVESLLRMAATRVPARASLRRVHVRVGVLTGVSPESLRFYFGLMRTGDAELDVVIEPLRATCGACGGTWDLPEPAWACPACAASALEFHNGLELDLIAIEIDDARDDSNRREDSR